MNASLLIFGGVVGLLLVLLIWFALSSSGARTEALNGRQEKDNRHIAYLPQIKQAFAETDFEYLKAHGSAGLERRVRRERRRLGLNYLSALRADFNRLQNFARLVAAMSPNVAIAQELLGLRLRRQFALRYQMIYLRLLTGLAPLDGISALSNEISSLTVRMETAIRELGERAALSAELSSSLGDFE